MPKPILKEILRQKGFFQYRIAKELGISRFAVMNYFAGRYKKAGKANCRLIKQWRLEKGLISPPKPRPRHDCPLCTKTHVIKVSHEK